MVDVPDDKNRMVDGKDFSELVDLDSLLLSIKEILEESKTVPRLLYTDEEDSDSEDEEDVEEGDYDKGRLTDKAKRYQREFGKYVESIRNDLEEMLYGTNGSGKDGDEKPYDKKKVTKDPGSDTSPSERGHKFGCGCRGCSSFREKFFSDGITDFSITDGRTSIMMRKDTKSYVRDHRDKAGDYPCGGKMRGMFQQGFLKYALSGIQKKPGLMRYMAV